MRSVVRQNLYVAVEVAAELRVRGVAQAEVERLVGLFEDVVDQLDLDRLRGLAIGEGDGRRGWLYEVLASRC